MKIEIVAEKKRLVAPIEMAPGQIGIARNGEGVFKEFNGHFVLAFYRGLVSLTKPSATWTEPDSTWPKFGVELLPEGTEIRLTV